MAAMTAIFKSFFSIFAASAIEPRSAEPASRRPAAPAGEQADEEQIFLASIAHLPEDERQKQLQKREWYRRLVQRQGIMEAEAEQARYRR